jgi:2-polyprenyl-6-methoxyphenol hydroxylase-like FAD-dependent oxidoreductase
MSDFDIAIVGGGMAGSTAAAMLGRAGFKTALIDPHETYPADFRCEKLDVSQVALLRKTGLAEAILPHASLDREVSVARFGRFLGKRPHEQYGIAYPTLVNAMRAAIPENVERIVAKATAFSLTAERQTVTLSNGREITARLVVMANGLNTGLRQMLGMEREVISPMHSISIGFDLRPIGGETFAFSSLTYGPESPADKVAYLTLFPMGDRMRANFFVYRDMRDPWLKDMRDAPRDTLFAALPGLKKLTGDIEVTSFVQIRPVDLYVTKGLGLPGVVVVGDAFATSCPAAGTGLNKVLTDVERLCHAYVPAWLASDGMGEAKIAAFYADPEKIASDRYSAEKAQKLRSLSIDTALAWRVRRWVRFLGLYGAFRLNDVRRALARLSGRGKPPVDGKATPDSADIGLTMAGAALRQRDSNA